MSTSRFLLPALTAVVLTLAAAISLARGQGLAAGDLAVADAWARATPPGAELGAVYVRVENRGQVEDRLVGASSPVAQAATLHESVEENGVALMRPMQAVPVPERGMLEMQPGGVHVMLMGLLAPLEEGASIPLTLNFEGAGEIGVSVPVLSIGSRGPVAEHDGHAR